MKIIMAFKMARIFKYGSVGSVPVVAFAILKAEEDLGKTSLVKPKDLPIYEVESQEPKFEFIEREINPLEECISVVRQHVWKWSDACQGAIDKTKCAYNMVEKTSQDVVTYVKTEEGFYPRAGVIGIAGLTGIVLARKGGFFRKLVYTGGLMTASAALCYPYKAVKISQAEYNWMKDRFTDIYNSESPVTTKTETVLDEIKEKDEDTKETVSTDAESALHETIPPSSPTGGKDDQNKDFGQSNPVDKDMYTTRS